MQAELEISPFERGVYKMEFCPFDRGERRI